MTEIPDGNFDSIPRGAPYDIHRRNPDEIPGEMSKGTLDGFPGGTANEMLRRTLVEALEEFLMGLWYAE